MRYALWETVYLVCNEMIDAADAQMYAAKQKGKNQVRHKTLWFGQYLEKYDYMAYLMR